MWRPEGEDAGASLRSNSGMKDILGLSFIPEFDLRDGPRSGPRLRRAPAASRPLISRCPLISFPPPRGAGGILFSVRSVPPW